MDGYSSENSFNPPAWKPQRMPDAQGSLNGSQTRRETMDVYSSENSFNQPALKPQRKPEDAQESLIGKQMRREAMDGYSSENHFNQPARKPRSIDGPHEMTMSSGSAPKSRLSNGGMERRPGESRRTAKRVQEEGQNRGGVTTDVTALMDNYFFFNSGHTVAGRGLYSGRDKYLHDYGNNGANDINSYRDNEELESRFVRTLEWVGVASKVISPSSSLARESQTPNSMRALVHSNFIESTKSDTLRVKADSFETNEQRSIVYLGDTKNKIDQSIAGDMVSTAVRRDIDASISRDLIERSSLYLPSSAINRGDMHATSQRTIKKPPPHVNSKVSAFVGDVRGDSTKALVTLDGVPSATCKLPCQSCGTGPLKKTDTVYGHHEQDCDKIDVGDRFQSKPSHAIGHYDRNDRLSRSAYHQKPQKKVHPNDNENFIGGQKVPNSAIGNYDRNDRLSRSAYHHNPQKKLHPKEVEDVAGGPEFSKIEARKVNEEVTRKEVTKELAIKIAQQEEGKAQTLENAFKEAAPVKTTAAKVHQWFSKLIGRKQDSPKKSKVGNSQSQGKPLPSTGSELVIPTMHDVLNNNPIVGSNSQVPRMRLEVPQRHSNHQLLQGPPTNSKPPSMSANSYGANLLTSNPPLTRPSQEEPRGPSRRFVDDAQKQRYDHGSRSERWAPQQARRDQPSQPREYMQREEQRLTRPPIKYESSEPERGSPTKFVRGQQQPWVHTRDADAKVGVQNTASLVSQDMVYQKQYLNELYDSSPQVVTPDQARKLEAVPISRGDQGRLMKIGPKQYAEANAQGVGQDKIIMNGNQYNPRAFVASYASQSERFLQRHRVNQDHDSTSRRPIDTRTLNAHDFVHKGNHGLRGNMQADEMMRQRAAPPPPEEVRDIDVLNSFLIQKRENLEGCSEDSRFHFILSTSSLSSMIAALCYSWILHNSKASKIEGWERVPLMSITRNEMWKYKQLAWLFDQAGLDTQALLFINEVDMDYVADSVSEYRISTIGQDIVRLRGEVASFCTVVAELFFKEIESSMQAKCIRILLLAGLLVDTDNLDSSRAFYGRRDELAASSLLPGAGHKGRAVLLAELKQEHVTEEFYNMMCEKFGEQPCSGMADEACNFKSLKVNNAILQSRKEQKYSRAPFSNDDLSEDTLSIAMSKSSKSYASISTTSTEQGKPRSNSASPP